MRGRLDLARNAGPGSPAAETLSHRGGRPPRTPGRSGPWCAPKAVSAAVAAEQARRKLNEETGKYLLADQISSNWAKTLGLVLGAIDEGLAELDLLLSLDEEGIAVLRKWWRDRRAGLADRLAANAADFPNSSRTSRREFTLAVYRRPIVKLSPADCEARGGKPYPLCAEGPTDSEDKSSNSSPQSQNLALPTPS